MNTTVYLCGPINGCNDTECRDWREYAKSKLRHTLDPMRRDYRGREAECAEEIVKGDMKDIEDCSVVLANCPKPSVGTSMEILLAHQQSKLVIAVVPDESTASPWLCYHCEEIHESLEDAIESIHCWFEDDDPRSMGWVGCDGLP